MDCWAPVSVLVCLALLLVFFAASRGRLEGLEGAPAPQKSAPSRARPASSAAGRRPAFGLSDAEIGFLVLGSSDYRQPCTYPSP